MTLPQGNRDFLDELFALQRERLAYRAYPDLESVQLLIPDSPTARKAAVSLTAARGPKARIARLASRAGSLLGARTFVSADIVREFADSGAFERAPSFVSFRLGRPGPSSRVVAQLADQDGIPVAYVKTATSSHGRRSLLNEAATLDLLSGNESLAGWLPTLMGMAELQSRFSITVKAINGERGPRSPGQPHLRFLSELGRATKVKEPSPRNIMGKSAPSDGETVLSSEADRLAELESWVIKEIGVGAIPLVRAHGDFTPWNSIFGSDGLVFIDWESSFRDATPGYDIFHFLTVRSISSRRGQATPSQIITMPIVEKNIRSVWPGGEKYVQPLYGAYLVHMGMDLANLRIRGGVGDGRLWDTIMNQIEDLLCLK